MKILIIANSDGGLYNFRRELLQQLISESHDITIAVPEGKYVNELKSIGCEVLFTPMDRHGTNVLKEISLIKIYKSIIKRVKPEIVFTYTVKPNIYGGIACTQAKIPYVANITGLGTAVEKRGILQAIIVNLYRYALRGAQTVFFQNCANEEFFTEKKLAVGKHKMLPGSGVNLDNYKLMNYPPEDILNFVFVGRIMKEKGIEQYFEAAEVIRKKYPYTRFHICGSFEQDYEDCLNRLQEKGVIIYHGSVKNMSEIYQMIHCTVHPTYYPEGLSNVLLESCACGRPIITTDRAGCREVVDDGVNGFVVKQKDSQDLIRQIEKFLSLGKEQRKQMGLAGRDKVEKEFDRNIVVNKYLDELSGNN